jgi:hypothetical protein
MPELQFRVEGAEPRKFAAEPSLNFLLRVSETIAPKGAPTPIQTVVLRCQIRIEPGRRRYEPEEKHRLRDLFGSADRWGQTLRPMLWTHITAVVPPFIGERIVDLPVPCSFDFNHAASRYFCALDNGDLPLCFLFSGTIFHENGDGDLQVQQISWEKESTFRLTAETWRDLMNAYYPDKRWLCMRKDLFDQLDQFKSDHGLISHDAAIERLLQCARELATS